MKNMSGMQVDLKIDIREIYARLDPAGKKVMEDYVRGLEVKMKPTEDMVKNVLGLT